MAWYAKVYGGYEHYNSEAQQNATEIYNILSGLGYSLTAICAVLGNIYKESGYNPWQWQEDDIQPLNGYSSSVGYGLVQWTPPGEYIASTVAQSYSGYMPNFSDRTGSPNDGNAQTHFIDYQIYGTTGNWFWNSSREQYYRSQFLADTGIDIANVLPISKEDFKSGDPSHTMYEYCIAFSLEYLRPSYLYAGRDYFKAINEADYWWEYFSGQPPTPPEPPTPTERNGMPIWMMIDYRY